MWIKWLVSHEQKNITHQLIRSLQYHPISNIIHVSPLPEKHLRPWLLWRGHSRRPSRSLDCYLKSWPPGPWPWSHRHRSSHGFFRKMGHIWPWVKTYGTIFGWVNIHLPAIINDSTWQYILNHVFKFSQVLKSSENGEWLENVPKKWAVFIKSLSPSMILVGLWGFLYWIITIPYGGLFHTVQIGRLPKPHSCGEGTLGGA